MELDKSAWCVADEHSSLQVNHKVRHAQDCINVTYLDYFVKDLDFELSWRLEWLHEQIEDQNRGRLSEEKAKLDNQSVSANHYSAGEDKSPQQEECWL